MIFAEKTSISEEDMAGFTYIEHMENVALALQVADYYGIERQTALRGMKKAIPDSGALMLFDLDRGDKRLIFANAFAANDPESTLLVWEILSKRLKKDQKFVIINNRGDRQTRTIQLADFVDQLDADHFFVVGTSTELMVSLMLKRGMDKARISDLGGKSCVKVYEKIFNIIKKEAFVIGIGNIGGIGHELVEYCETGEGD